MLRINANIQFMFNEYPLLDRYDAAARAGFKGVEVQAPYSESVSDIKARLDANGLEHVIINLPVADPDTGLNNLPLLASKRDLYRERVDLGVRYASELGCVGVNTGTGQLPDGMDAAEAYDTYIENLSYTAAALAAEGVKAFVEPLNTRDNPGQLISTSADGMAAIKDAGHPNLELQYDFYHTQIMEGDLIEKFKALLPSIGHVQFADNPGRHEPGTGEINYDAVFAAVDASGYGGWVGAEYHPSRKTEETLDWFRRIAA